MRKKALAAAYVLGSIVLMTVVTVPAIAARANPAVSTAALDPLTASIIGPTTVRPNSMCLYQSDVQGGTPPYTYSWTGPGSSSSDPDFIENNYGSGSSYWVILIVDDAAGNHIQKNLAVSTNSNAMLCPY